MFQGAPIHQLVESLSFGPPSTCPPHFLPLLLSLLPRGSSDEGQRLGFFPGLLSLGLFGFSRDTNQGSRVTYQNFDVIFEENGNRWIFCAAAEIL
jgi:hypothetical protein